MARGENWTRAACPHFGERARAQRPAKGPSESAAAASASRRGVPYRGGGARRCARRWTVHLERSYWHTPRRAVVSREGCASPSAAYAQPDCSQLESESVAWSTVPSSPLLYHTLVQALCILKCYNPTPGGAVGPALHAQPRAGS
eukprot:7234151-Prymnesium_polylepis.3